MSDETEHAVEALARHWEDMGRVFGAPLERRALWELLNALADSVTWDVAGR